MKNNTVYIDLFGIYDLDFMYWYISTDGVNYVMQSLNVGKGMVNDFYSINGIEKSALKKEYDSHLDEKVWVYQLVKGVTPKYKIRMYQCSYADFTDIVMSAYSKGRRMPKIRKK